MDLENRGEGPFTDLLIDLGDSFYESATRGFKYDSVGADGCFDAEEAILDVFGGVVSRPNIVELTPSFPNGVIPVPKPPTHSPNHIFRGDGGAAVSEANNKEQQQPFEAPQVKKQGDASSGFGGGPAPQQRSGGSFGNHHTNFSHGPPVASSSPFKQQFRTGGFSDNTAHTSTGFGRSPFTRPSGFGAATPNALNAGSKERGGYGEPPKNLVLGGPSGDCSGFGNKPPATSSGFGKAPSGFKLGGFEDQPPNESFGRFGGTPSSGFGTQTSGRSSGFGTQTSGRSSGFGSQTSERPSGFGTQTSGHPSGFGTQTSGHPSGFGARPSGSFEEQQQHGGGSGIGSQPKKEFKTGGFEIEVSGSKPGGFGSTNSNSKASVHVGGGGTGSGFGRAPPSGGFGSRQQTGGLGGQNGGDGFGSAKAATGFKSGGFESAGAQPARGFGGQPGFGGQFGGSGKSQSGIGGVGGFASPSRGFAPCIGFGGGQERGGGFSSGGDGRYRPALMELCTPPTDGGPRFGSNSVAHSSSTPVVSAALAKNDLFSTTGFGPSNDNEHFHSSSRPGRSGRGAGRGNKRSGRRGTGTRGRSSPSGFSMNNEETPNDAQENAWKHGAAAAPAEQPQENAEEPSDFGAKRAAQNFGGDRQPAAETTPKRRRMSCRNCGRPGHLAPSCYSTQNKDTMRCYNCNQMGHLSVRCPLPRDPTRGRPRARAPTCSTFNGNASETTGSQNGSNVTDSPRPVPAADANNNRDTGLGVSLMCKLMQDVEVRHDLELAHPDLHDDIIMYMLRHLEV